MTADERARRAADDVKAVVATTDFDALRIRVRSRATAPSRLRRALPGLEVAAVLLLVAGGVGLLIRAGGGRSADTKFAAVGSSISGGGSDTVHGRAAGGTDAYADANALDAQAIVRALGPGGPWTMGLHLRVTPVGDVADGSARLVRATGLEPGHTYLVVQCVARTPASPRLPAWACDPIRVRTVVAPAWGSIAVHVTVRRHLHPTGLAPVDCTGPSARCALALVAAVPAAGVTEAAVSPLHFRPLAASTATTTTTP